MSTLQCKPESHAGPSLMTDEQIAELCRLADLNFTTGMTCPSCARKIMHDIRSHRADDAIEAEIQAKGLTAPRITPADIEANIVSEHYINAGEALNMRFMPESSDPSPLSLLTFCVLVLRNGFTVTGESACASLENFDAEIGKKIARADAIRKVWPLMGDALRSELAGSSK